MHSKTAREFRHVVGEGLSGELNPIVAHGTRRSERVIQIRLWGSVSPGANLAVMGLDDVFPGYYPAAAGVENQSQQTGIVIVTDRRPQDAGSTTVRGR
jgi:hypothetical protein